MDKDSTVAFSGEKYIILKTKDFYKNTFYEYRIFDKKFQTELDFDMIWIDPETENIQYADILHRNIENIIINLTENIKICLKTDQVNIIFDSLKYSNDIGTKQYYDKLRYKLPFYSNFNSINKIINGFLRLNNKIYQIFIDDVPSGFIADAQNFNFDTIYEPIRDKIYHNINGEKFYLCKKNIKFKSNYVKFLATEYPLFADAIYEPNIITIFNLDDKKIKKVDFKYFFTGTSSEIINNCQSNTSISIIYDKNNIICGFLRVMGRVDIFYED